MQCLHGMGFTHLLVDLFLLLPFIGIGIFWIRYKFKKGKKENE